MRLLHVFDDLQEWASKRPFQVVLMLVLAGIVLALFAHAIHISGVVFTGQLAGRPSVAVPQGGKQVGYFFAPNWAAFSVLILPFVVGACLKMRAEMEPALRRLADAKMVRDEDFAAISEDVLVARWRVDRRANSFAPFMAFAVALSFVGVDFWSSVKPTWEGLPSKPPPLSSTDLDYDWSIACRMTLETPVSCGANLVFDAAAYLLVLGLGVAFVVGCMVEAAMFTFFVVDRTKSPPEGALPTTWNLSASPADPNDPLCGFRALAPFFTWLLVATFLILPSLVILIFQNTYLRDPASNSIGAFAWDDIKATAEVVFGLNGKYDLVEVLKTLFVSKAAGTRLENLNTLIGMLVFALVFVGAFAACWGVLHKGAQDAQDYAIANVAKLGEELETAQPVLLERLKGMQFWPLGWLKWHDATVILVFMGLAVFSYRLAFLPIIAPVIGFLIAYVRGLAQKLFPPAKPPAAQPPAAPAPAG